MMKNPLSYSSNVDQKSNSRKTTSVNPLRTSLSNLRTSLSNSLRNSEKFFTNLITSVQHELVQNLMMSERVDEDDGDDKNIKLVEIAPPACPTQRFQLRIWDPTRCKCLTWRNNSEVPDEVLIQSMNYWQSVCGVRFYKEEENPFFTFEVATKKIEKHPNNSGAVALSFYPGQEERKIYIFKKFSTLKFNQVAALSHELGHMLGFRHEQFINNNNSNEETDNLVAITDYDNQSIMYCMKIWDDEKNNTKTFLSKLDIEGSQRVYGLPLIS